MPQISSSFSPPCFLRPAWLQTIAPALLRRTPIQAHTRQNLELPDGDVLELIWFPALQTDKQNNSHREFKRLVIITHGLEGSSESSYVIGLVCAFLNAGYTVLAWNMRGCGSAPNLLPSWYHSGQSQDLHLVVQHARACYPDHQVYLVGVSIGGNILCKYLGEIDQTTASVISAAVAVSAPLDLRGSAAALTHPSRRIYMEYLLRPLRARIREKAQRFPQLFSIEGLDKIKTFQEFDARFTAPMHGFTSVDQYWDLSSGAHYLDAVRTPLLILTAQDDPFLSVSCIPTNVALRSSNIWLETPAHGGHVGFIDTITMRTTWLERRSLEFFKEQMQEPT